MFNSNKDILEPDVINEHGSFWKVDGERDHPLIVAVRKDDNGNNSDYIEFAIGDDSGLSIKATKQEVADLIPRLKAALETAR